MSDIHALTGAYALDALDDVERVRVERHLAECDDCREEVASFQESAALMGTTEATAPPRHLRDAVLRDIRTVRPLPPVRAPHTASWRRRVPALVAAAALVLLGGSVATVWHPWADDDAPAVAMTRVQDAPDAQTFASTFADRGRISVVRSSTQNQAVMSVRGLGRLPDGKVYELWLLHDGDAVRAGTIDGDASSVLLEGDPASATAAAITIERGSGGTNPRGPQVVQVPFEHA